jgi:hypothetical protein
VKELRQVRDAAGNVLGFFAPIAQEHARSYAEGAGRLDPLELERRKSNKELGRTTEQVFEHLLSITPDEEMRAFLREKIDGLKERDRYPTP